MRKLLLFLILTFFIIVFNCEYFTLMSKNEWAEKSEQEEDEVIIYASGAWFDSNVSDYKPCYWKITKDDHEKFDLESNDLQGIAYSIFVVGDTVHTCGYCSTLSLTQIPCYWKNKKQYVLPVDSSTISSEAKKLFVKNGVVFTAGIASNNSNCNTVYWIDQNQYQIYTEPSISSYAECIFIQQLSSGGHNIYIGGMYSGKPCYWKNGEINYLEYDGADNMAVRSIYVLGNTIYSCGNKTLPAPEVACFWKNEKLTYLQDGINTSSLFISGEDVYIAGIDNTGVNEACYWKNNNKSSLPLSYFSSGNSYAFSIYIFNNNVYIGGYDCDASNTNYRAWYCINGKKTFIDTSLNTAISSIFVKADNEN